MSNIYLSGPMTGYPDHNEAAFLKAAAKWRRLGYTVYNPHENFGGNLTLPRSEYLAADLAEIVLHRPKLVLLDRWEFSAGARLEVRVAHAIGCAIVFNETGQPVDVNFYISTDEAWAEAWGELDRKKDDK